MRGPVEARLETREHLALVSGSCSTALYHQIRGSRGSLRPIQSSRCKAGRQRHAARSPHCPSTVRRAMQASSNWCIRRRRKVKEGRKVKRSGIAPHGRPAAPLPGRRRHHRRRCRRRHGAPDVQGCKSTRRTKPCTWDTGWQHACRKAPSRMHEMPSHRP